VPIDGPHEGTTPGDGRERPGRSSGDKPVDDVDNTVTQRRTKPSFRQKTDQSPPQATAPAGSPATDSGDGALHGSDLARAALHAAQASAAKTRGQTPKQSRGGGAGRGGTMARRRRRWSGAQPDERDPQPLGRLAARIASDRGWAGRLAGGQVFGKWAALVGSDVAEHTRPVQLNDGELTVEADSTAWATQLRLLQRQLLAKIAAGVGHGVVKRLKVQGPSAPSWRHGPRHVPGRGPRDTYG
jgi:predicted nucleic acid-binding Zn ribbon protein